jgi:hypothetical protein
VDGADAEDGVARDEKARVSGGDADGVVEGGYGVRGRVVEEGIMITTWRLGTSERRFGGTLSNLPDKTSERQAEHEPKRAVQPHQDKGEQPFQKPLVLVGLRDSRPT